MLRVTKKDNQAGATLVLEGKLSGPWVDEVQKCWADCQGAIQVNLQDVSYVDSRGKDLLIRMERDGVALVDVSDFIRHLLSENAAGEGHSATSSEKS